MIKEYFLGLYRDRYVLGSLVTRDLQLKYRKSFLGIAWSVITPMGLVIIIGSVYSIVFGADPKYFIPLIFTGLNPWIFINICADGGTGAFLNAEGYLKQTTVNAQIFPVRIVLNALVNLIYSIIAYFAIYIFLLPDAFSPIMLFTFPGIVIIFIFGLSLANIASILNLNIRDYQPLQGLIMQGLFYATPIIFQPEMLEVKGFGLVYKLNPLYYLIEIIRRPMLGERVPSLSVYMIAIFISMVMFLFSIIMVMKEKKGIAYKL